MSQLLLTISCYNQDKHVEAVEGFFKSEEQIDAHLKKHGWEDPEWGRPSPSHKIKGMVAIKTSEKYWDDGWGGRYATVWKFDTEEHRHEHRYDPV